MLHQDGYSFGGYGGMIGNARLLSRQRVWVEDSVHVRCAEAAAGTGGAWQCAVQFALVGKVRQVSAMVSLCWPL